MTKLTRGQREDIVVTFWAVLVYAALAAALIAVLVIGVIAAVEGANRGDWAVTWIMGIIFGVVALMLLSWWFVKHGGD